MSHGKGFIRDPKGHKFTAFRAVPGIRKASDEVPDTGGPIMFAAPVSDQITVGQCVSHGLLDSVFTNLASKGKPIASPLSHDKGYKLARAIARADWSPDVEDLQPLQDNGCEPNQLARALTLYGCPLAKDVDNGTLDAIPSIANRELMLHESIACRFFPVEFHGVGDMDGDKIQQLVRALADGYSFALAIEAGEKFNAYSGVGVLGSDGGNLDHMVHCLLYRKAPNGYFEFWIQNSWSPGWGAGGCAWVDEGFMRNAGNILIPRVIQ